MSTQLLQWLAIVTVGVTAATWAVLAFASIAEAWEHPTLHREGGGRRIFYAVLEITPAPTWLARRITSADQRLLRQAGTGLSTQQYAALRWLAICLALTAVVLLGLERGWDLINLFLCPLLLLAGWRAPGLWLRWRIENRSAAIDRTLPDLIDRLVLGLEAGLGFEPVLRRTARNFPGLLGDELRYLIRQIDLGHVRGEVLQQLAERNPSHRVAAFTAAVRQSDRLGTSLVRVLRIQSCLLRAFRRRQVQEAGRRLPILIVFPLVFFLLPALLIIYLAPPVLHLVLGS